MQNNLCLLQDQKWMGADLDVPGKKPLFPGQMQIYFGVDKSTVGTATAPVPPYAMSARVRSEQANEVEETISSTWKTR